MGTSGSYGGSRGRGWARARASAQNLPNDPSQEDIDRLVADIATAINWQPDPPDTLDDAPGTEPAAATTTIPAVDGVPISWGPISARRAAGGGGGGGGGAPRGGGASGRPGTGTRGGGRRSSAAAARTASRGAGAAYALLRGDVGSLLAVGLQLVNLVGLTPAEQAQRIAAGVVGASIIEAERKKALDRMLVAILESRGTLTPAEAAKVFAQSYVYEVMLTEIDGALRDGRRDGAWTADVERRIEDVIVAVVTTQDLDNSAGPAEIEGMINVTLERARSVLAERRRQ